MKGQHVRLSPKTLKDEVLGSRGGRLWSLYRQFSVDHSGIDHHFPKCVMQTLIDVGSENKFGKCQI